MSFSQPTHAELVGAALTLALTFVAGQTWVNSVSAPESAMSAGLITPPQAEPDDGEVPDGATVFDDQYAAVSSLDEDLLGALRDASDASGITFEVSSGWRSGQYQRRLFMEAVAKYGSVEEAARWAAPPGTFVHEEGNAVDISNSAAVAWLASNGARFGLCQIYANEPWHWELRPEAENDGCPTMHADAAR